MRDGSWYARLSLRRRVIDPSGVVGAGSARGGMASSEHAEERTGPLPTRSEGTVGAAAPAVGPIVQTLLGLQQTIGNAAVCGLVRSGGGPFLLRQVPPPAPDPAPPTTEPGAAAGLEAFRKKGPYPGGSGATIAPSTGVASTRATTRLECCSLSPSMSRSLLETR
jgi:hypothetical protein